MSVTGVEVHRIGIKVLGRSGTSPIGAVSIPFGRYLPLSLFAIADWTVHQFFVPVRPQSVVKPRTANQRQKDAVNALKEKEKPGVLTRYRVFGMTARMLVDVARVAYAEEPEFEHNSHFGDERLIAQLRKMGRLSSRRKSGDILTREDMEKAAKLS